MGSGFTRSTIVTVTRPISTALQKWYESENPFAQDLETAFIPSKTANHPAFFFIDYNCVMIVSEVHVQLWLPFNVDSCL